jgi:hypothetical protein
MTDGASPSPQEPPTEGGEDSELLSELKRIKSDLGFRRWTRLRVKTVAILVGLDLFISCGTAYAVWKVDRVQTEACERDNDLRRAYLQQWRPLLVDAQTKDDPASRDVVARFGETLDAFKTHNC